MSEPTPLDSLEAPTPAAEGARRVTASAVAHLAVILIATILRLLAFPHFDETRDIDETGYLKGSLCLIEGLPPGYKAAPAGPNTWLGWGYTGGVAAMHLLHPGSEERGVSLQVRPFVALDHALFDEYHDLRRQHALWIAAQLALAVWAASAAYRFGRFRGGVAGGLYVGGALAIMPLFVSYTDMSRPYMTAWSFGVLALCSAAVGNGRSRRRAAAIFLGLAVSSRVEMLLFAPLVLWEFCHRRENRPLLRVGGKVIGLAVVTALIAAPWLVTHLIGNLRTIATVRLGPNPNGPTTLSGTLIEIAWRQGFAGAMVLFVMAIFVLPLKRRSRRDGRGRIMLSAAYVTCLVLSMAKGTVFLHQQGPILLALIVFGVFALPALAERSPRATPWLVALVLALPLARSFEFIMQCRRAYSPDHSAAWIASHVPPGTRLYTQYSLQDPLPTPGASRFLWDEVADDQAWRNKFRSGLERFHLSEHQIPRALSDENLVQERGNRRGMFILGGRENLPEPRFDVRIYNGSAVFGVPDVAAAFAETGGVVVWRGNPAPADFGQPIAQWTNAEGAGTFIYCSADVRARLDP